jgi:hypothetical protein
MRQVGLAVLFVLVLASFAFARDPYSNRRNILPENYRLASVSPITLFGVPPDAVKEIYPPANNFNFWTVITKSGGILSI